LPKKYDYSDWSKDDLIKRIHELEKRKKYGLVWDEEREPEKLFLQCKKELPVLKEVKEKEIKNDPDKPTHILIEGDNYHALSVLSYTHENSVDLIFIDPPYNIGGDFIYNDKIVDPEDSYRHSKWLSFMKKRLELARYVLKDTGAIFITIDDEEASHLKLLCDEIFLPQNFIAQICWQKKFSPQNDATYFSDMHDFILVYAKRKKTKKSDKESGFDIQGLIRTDEMLKRYSNPDNDPRGLWTSSDCSVKTYSKDYDYPIKTPSGRIVRPPESRCWFTSKERFQALVDDNRIWFGEDGNNVPRLKKFLSEVKEDITPTTWWPHSEVGHNQEAKQEMKKILHDVDNVFNTPKPVRLMKRIITLATRSDNHSVILDFFAGSGTTAQAVLELNSEDGGNRQFILVTNNENNICVESTYPRIKRVIEGYDFQGNEKTLLFEEKLNLTKLKKVGLILDEYERIKVEQKENYDELKGEFKENTLRLWGINKNLTHKEGVGGNLKYYKTDFVPAKATDVNKEKLTKQSVEMLCLRENTFDPVLEEETIKIFQNKEKYTAILFDQLIIPKLKEIIRDYDKPVHVYVFSLGDDDFADEFSDMKEKVTVKSIPAAILRVYRRIFK